MIIVTISIGLYQTFVAVPENKKRKEIQCYYYYFNDIHTDEMSVSIVINVRVSIFKRSITPPWAEVNLPTKTTTNTVICKSIGQISACYCISVQTAIGRPAMRPLNRATGKMHSADLIIQSSMWRYPYL